MQKNIYAVIMAGGSGTRLWPMSRKENPKQFIDFFGSGTMIQQTINRLNSLILLENILIVTNKQGELLVKKQLPSLLETNIIVEPMSKNTAPCIALVSAMIKKRNPDAIVAVLPSDHIISEVEIFRQTLRAGYEVAKKTKSLVMIGVKPLKPETGFGYIQRSSEPTGNIEKEIKKRFGVASFRVKTFAEKPDKQTAKAFIDSGDFYWNSGMFIWHIDAIWQEMEKTMPHLFIDMKNIYEAIGTKEEGEVIEKTFTWVKSISIDYGVMEKSRNVFIIEGKFNWSDGGSWDELAKLHKISNNIFHPDLILKDAKNVTMLKSSDRGKVAVIGLSDIIIVQTEDVILICKKGESQKVKRIVEHFREKDLNEYL